MLKEDNALMKTQFNTLKNKLVNFQTERDQLQEKVIALKKEASEHAIS